VFVTLVVITVVTVLEAEDKGYSLKMNIINTSAPIVIDQLKEYFTNKESTSFLIDYQNSKLKGSKLLIYLSNLDIPCNIVIDTDSDEFLDLISSYLRSSFIVNIESLEKITIEILLRFKGLSDDDTYDTIIENNRDILNKWSSILDSLPLYNMLTLNIDEFNEFVEQATAPEVDDSLSGINFVSILKHENFYNFYETWSIDQASYYEDIFNSYMFKGKNLFSYWANPNNPLFLLTFGIGEDLSDGIKEKLLTV